MYIKKYVALISIIVAASLGSYGYAYYDAANKIDVEITNISITNMSGNIFKLEIESITLGIDGIASTQGIVSVSIDEAKYSVTIEGEDFGIGIVTELHATREGGSFTAYHEIKIADLSPEAIAIIMELLDKQEKIAKILIFEIKIFGIVFEYEFVVEKPISSTTLLNF